MTSLKIFPMHHPHTLHIFRFLYQCAFVVLALFAGTTAVHAQDLIARQAPVDRKMKAVDSVAISRALRRQRLNNYEQNDLYHSWNTSRVHCYDESELPDTYRIDLRGFAMPTPSRVITSNYGYRASFGRMHKGLDIKVYIGDTIVSAFDGKVRVVAYEGKGYGNYVVIRHNNGLETIYGHLSKHLCKVGDVVRAGEPIGLGGNTGRSTGSHLHFETRLLGEAIDPAVLFDFVHQDVTCDFYDYTRRSGSHTKTEAEPALASTTKSNDAQQPSILEVLEEQQDRAAELASNVTDNDRSSSKKSKRNKQQERKVYKVRKGDTLYSISHKVGVSVSELCSRNRINKRTTLQLGQILRY